MALAAETLARAGWMGRDSVPKIHYFERGAVDSLCRTVHRWVLPDYDYVLGEYKRRCATCVRVLDGRKGGGR